MRRVIVLLGPALLLAACSAATPAPTVSPGPAVTATTTAIPAATPSLPGATARPTPTPVPVAGCPAGSPLTVRQYVEADPACFDDADVTIRAWLDTPPAMGWEPPLIEPGWLIYPPSNWSTLFNARPTNPEHSCAEMAPECPWFFLHIDPESGLAVEPGPRWLLVTGHRQDPASATCHWVDPDGLFSPLPSDADAVASCRDSFVLVSFRDAP